MSTAYCPKCKSPMESLATKCPKCGYDFADVGEPGGRQYEFTEGQNRVIALLAKRLTVVSLAALLVGLLFAVAAVQAIFRSNWPDLGIAGLIAVLGLAVGVCGLFASYSFRQVTNTGRGDIDNLMDALSFLSGMFSIASGVVIAFALLLIAGWAIRLAG